MEDFKIFKSILLFILALSFIACQDYGLFESQGDNGSLNLVEDEVIKIVEKDVNIQSCYPLFGEVNFYWLADSGWYEGGAILLEDGTMFHVKSDALIPPKELLKDEKNKIVFTDNNEILPVRKPIKVTMRVDKDEQKDELIYTFTPHGAVFKKSARIVFSYTALDCDVASLYYIEDDGSYTEQSYDDIDIKGKKIYLYVDHFSRYAMSYGK